MEDIFWLIYLGLLGTVAIGFLIKGKYKTAIAKLDFVISIITWIGLFGYVTNTQILTPIVWKVVFFGGLIWDITFSLFLHDYYGEEIDEEPPVLVKYMMIIIVLVIFVGPLYYGLYRYAF